MLKHSKIGLAKLNVWQEEEFCVKLVAPLQHNQMMRPRFGYCFSFNQSWGGNFKKYIIFSREVQDNNLLLNRKTAN